MPPMKTLFSMSRSVTFFCGDECADVAIQLASIVKAAAGLPYTKTSRSGPVPESNFAAIFSLML